VRVLSVGCALSRRHTLDMPPDTPPSRSGLGAAAVGGTFDEVVLPHLEAGRRLARWLMRNQQDADDVVQEACLRAYRYFRTFTGGDGRAWFLRIVRNTSYGWHRYGLKAATDAFDEEQHSGAFPQPDPETLLLQADDADSIRRAMHGLPAPFLQMLVLREIEGLSYRELADVIGIPVGTVMSRLSRARQALRGALLNEPGRSAPRPTPRRRERQADAVLV
jgi:RNA polymerase sigma-70 factor (ECF subfamily)